MPRFIARRLVATVPLLFLISVLAFSLVLLLPGDPALAILGDEVANANDRQAYFALRAEMGLDEPIPVQYLRWAGRVLRGDLGISIRNQTPIGETIGAKILPTVADVFAQSDMIVKVKEPQAPEIAMLEARHLLFTYLHLAADKPQAEGLMKSGLVSSRWLRGPPSKVRPLRL